MPTPDGLRITQHVPGGEPVDLTRAVASGARWSSTVPGGFGSATLSIPRILTSKERALLGGLVIEYEGKVLFDGRVEDAKRTWQKSGLSTQLQAFGYQRLLTDCSTRRAWSIRRDLTPTPVDVIKGSSSGGAMVLRADLARYIVGRYKPSDPTKFGFRMAIVGGINAQDAIQVSIALPAGIAAARIQFDLVIFYSITTNWRLTVHSTADGATYTLGLEQQNAGSTTAIPISVDLVAGTREIRISATAVTGGVVALTDGSDPYVEISNMRVLGTSLSEDSAGGFYGGTIIRDLVSQCPGLYPGTIDDGSDFVISEIARVNRTSVLDVVDEVDANYAKEWGVWEAGRFDWVAPDLKAPGWLIDLKNVSELEVEESIDALHRRTYVTFTDAADELAKEAFADTASGRNPYLRLGVTKDGVVASPVALTALTAPILAAKLNSDQGRWATITGTLTLPAQTLVRAANSARQVPAFAIRAGENCTIPELGAEDIYAAGQDGQTVFHITSVEATIDGTVQLTLEGLTKRSDVLLARLAAVSQ